MKKLLILLILVCIPIILLHAENFVNKQWQVASGNPLDTQFQVSTLNSYGELVVATNILHTGQGSNFKIVKYNGNGTVNWATEFNSDFNLNDYPTCISIDASGYIYVAGISLHSSSNYDVSLIKLDGSGTILWDFYYNSSHNHDDISADMKIDATNNIYLTGLSKVGFSDYAALLLKIDDDGHEIWHDEYNPDSLYDATIYTIM